jgi:Protein of unknown function (DUF3631)
MCARWADDYAEQIAEINPDMNGLINRTADNWRPLFAIADVIGLDWPVRIREAAAALAPRESDTTGTMVLADILAIFDERGERIWSEELCEHLAAIEGRPWAEFGKARKPISKHQLARLLARFHIEPDNVRIGERVKRGYHRHQFVDASQRYLGEGSSEPLQRYNDGEMGTRFTNQTATDQPSVAVQKCEKPAPNRHCSVVAISEGGSGRNETASEGDFVDAQHKCEHCRRYGETMQVAYGATQVWLHRECIEQWRVACDQLDIRNRPFYRPDAKPASFIGNQ